MRFSAELPFKAHLVLWALFSKCKNNNAFRQRAIRYSLHEAFIVLSDFLGYIIIKKSIVFWEPALVGRYKVVTEGDDVVGRQLGGGVWIGHGRLVYALLFPCHGGLDSQKLRIDVRAV